MRNQFLIDKDFSRKYEMHFSDVIEREEYGTINENGDSVIFNNVCEVCDGLHDDHGCDIYQKLSDEYGNIQGVRRIDVKCYRKPKFKKYFDGLFIETFLPLSGRPGWFEDESKTTTHYLFVINCSEENIEYDEAWLVEKTTLKWLVEKAKSSDDIIYKEINSAHGFILPYGYIREEGEQIVD